ncbi:hypothetical protein [Microbacterium lushaniae]|uniref:Glycoside hydrolase family 38 N-terminal domain-containing protein n=1 Tax=Microbacterium lushaniae TaxID=2614639 RepID=A0A5J6L087_9MICO|nr:hypothetical protein [Microbacterium lushaniae]QEW01898.1 hypothetical protein F6J85_01465 [Microbacterium lushaniae]
MPIREILLIGHTHHDVGYTNSPRLIDRMHADIVGRVLDLAEEHPGQGPAAFRWTFEVARPVLTFLRRATAGQREQLSELARTGAISVTGGYLNMTQLPSTFEFDAAYDLLGEIRQAGIPVRTEQHGDVNGLAWGLVDRMRDAGIGRLVMALNPDHGRAPFTQPSGFWWEGPSGRRVFVWLSTHYGFGEEWGIVDGDVALAERRIQDFVERLDAREDYPWSAAVVHAGNDNRWPTARFLDVVRTWNARHPDLPMRAATIDEALDGLEAEAEAADRDIPTVRGEWADWWSHGHGSTAREVAVYREARTFARAAESTFALAALAEPGDVPLFDVLGYRRGPVRLRSSAEVAEAMQHIFEQLLLYGEHTWGSWETYSKPHSTFSHSHHNAKSGFAYDAFDQARDLAIEGWFGYAYAGSGAEVAEGAADAAGEGALVVVNPTEAPRSELVDVEVAGVRRVRALAEVGPFGVAVIPVPGPGEEEAVTGPVEAGRYRVAVDPGRGGIVSLVDVATGRELVDTAAAMPLGALVDERVVAGSQHPMLTQSPKHFHPDHPGPEFSRDVATGTAPPRVRRAAGVTQITWEGSAPGIPRVVTTLAIADDIPDLELDVWLSKPERFEPESVFVAFPFQVANPEFLLETAGAVFAAEREQLPDTSKDWYSIQHAVGVGGDGGGVLWGTRDAPLVQVGDFHTGRWARRLEAVGGHVNSWLMNNLHFTNFQARQEITRVFRYRFRPVDAVSAADVRRYGRDLLEPLHARHTLAPPPARPAPPVTVEPAERLLAELRPAGEGQVRVRLRNITGNPVTAVVRGRGPEAPVEVPASGVADILLPAR